MAVEQEDPAKAAKSELNMTPMIDVTFQLIIVFLCSMKFRTLDMKIEAFLPKDVGLSAANPTSTVETKLILTLKRRPGEDTTQVILLESRIGSSAEEGVWNKLAAKIREFHGQDAEIKGEINAQPDVPHGDVMHALDAFLAGQMTNIVFKGTPLNESGQFGPPPPR